MGLEGAALEDVTTAFLGVSRAMEEDAGPMIKAVADAMIAMGEPAENTEKFLDQLTVASQSSGVPMTALADMVVKFGPQLNELGLPLADATALIANMEAKGLDVGKMMPGLNTAIKKLADEGVTDITGGLQDAIAEIENAETDAAAMGIAMDLFGAGAGIRFKDAIDKGAFSIDGPGGLLEAMKNSEDTVITLAAETLTMSDKMDIMKNKVKGALTPIGNFATALGPMVIMIPALATGISAMAASQTIATAATWLQSAAMTALNFAMGPIGLVILAIVAAVVLAIAIFKNWDKIVAAFNLVIEAIKPIFKTVKDFILTALENLKERWDTIWNGMKEVVKTIANPIIGVINSIIGGINTLLSLLNKITIGWAAKKVLGVTVLPAFSLSPFNFPMIPKIPLMAQGGIVRSPTLAMLGEAGPEAVVPLGRGGMGGGITINILGPTYGFDDFEERVSEAITDGVRRGGFSGILAPA
jgi:phage-related minor tail protein